MIGIICGEGNYPKLVAQHCIKKKQKCCLIFIGKYERHEDYPDVPKVTVKLGQIGSILGFFRFNDVDKVILAGHIKRPGLFDLSLDSVGVKWLAKLWKPLLFSGDDALLRSVGDLLAKENIKLVAGTDYLSNQVFIKEGIFSKRVPTEEEQQDVHLGIREAQMLGMQDIGQCVVVSNGKIIGKEDKSGTDALIDRCYDGILIKTSKPQQDSRMDLPTVGPQTIENLYNHGFKGLVIEADKTIVVDKEKVIRKVNEYGLFFQAIKLKRDIKVFIMAGEASGDYLGGRLMKDMRKINENIEFVGVGGQCMEQAELFELFSISKLSIIGIWEVIGKIFQIKKLIKQTAKFIVDYNPNVLISIDSSGFTHRVDKLVKKMNPDIPIVHYVAPPVWAWRKWRVKDLYKFIDKLMVLFPFEKDIFSKYDLDTAFVGHPVASDEDFSINEEERASSKNLTITLLPGSRKSEIEAHMPILKKFAELMSEKYPGVQFYLPTVKEVAPLIKEYVKDWKVKPIVSTKKMKKVKAYNLSHLAVAASGTVTLELAKMKLPFIAIYKTSFITYHLVKWLIQVPYVCLVNILSGKFVVPELLQDECTPENIYTAAENIITLHQDIEQKKQFGKIIKQLSIPRSKSAEEVFSVIKK